MNWNGAVRQSHRWISIAFTVTVIANFIALARGRGMPPPWITYSPLLPLALLLFSGLYLFVLPYAVRWRGAQRTCTQWRRARRCFRSAAAAEPSGTAFLPSAARTVLRA